MAPPEIERVSSLPAVTVLVDQRGLLALVGDGEHHALDPGSLALIARASVANATSIQDLIAELSDGQESVAVELEATVAVLQSGISAGPPLPAGTGKAAQIGEIATIEPATVLVLPIPQVFVVVDGMFEALDHDGVIRARLSVDELLYLAQWNDPRTSTDPNLHTFDLTQDDCRRLLQEAVQRGLLVEFDADRPELAWSYRRQDHQRKNLKWQVATRRAIKAQVEAHDARSTGGIPIRGFNRSWNDVPLALGLIYSYAQVHDGGVLRDTYDFRPEWLTPPDDPIPDGPGIWLYSHYIWNSHFDVEHSNRVREANPLAVTVHGGPNVPKYDGDVEEFFAQHPSVDVTVRGEGEITAAELFVALAPQLATGEPADLSVLADVPGLYYRGPDGRPVRTAERDRLTDLDVIPSPYLTGVFDGFGEAHARSIIIETNRGCPYGCTFCDWGSATASRIRKFDLDRIMAELDWAAAHQVEEVGIADANFGIFERDIEIAEKIASLKKAHGFPRHVGMNYAKNTVKHIRKIVDAYVGADILAIGQLSLQSVDPGTLTVIKRSNIKVEKYEDLAGEFRRNNLPLYVELMMGLPGSTLPTFRNDLQQCIDREVHPKVYPTQLLINSPMNDPAYRAEQSIAVKPGELVTSASSFTRTDYEQMDRLRRAFLFVEKFGVLRYLSRWVRQETGRREIDQLTDLLRVSQESPADWPVLAYTLRAAPSVLIAPGSWKLLLDEVGRFLAVNHQLEGSDAHTMIEAQRSLIPERTRRYPFTVDLEHDFVAWHTDMIGAKERGEDWVATVAPLSTRGEGQLTIDDPHRIAWMGIGRSVDSLASQIGGWDLDSPVARNTGVTDYWIA